MSSSVCSTCCISTLQWKLSRRIEQLAKKVSHLKDVSKHTKADSRFSLDNLAWHHRQIQQRAYQAGGVFDSRALESPVPQSNFYIFCLALEGYPPLPCSHLTSIYRPSRSK